MTDVVDAATRSRIMSRIRSRDTKPEMFVRRALFARGFRYRIHDKRLPGKPDVVLPLYDAVIQINGCFWHGHDCPMFRMPSSRRKFWREKIGRNQRNDVRNNRTLKELGWYVLTVWECALKGPGRVGDEEVIERIVHWITSVERSATLRGRARR